MILDDIESYLSNKEIHSDKLFEFLNRLSVFNKCDRNAIISKLILKLTLFDISDEEIKLLLKNKPFSRIILMKQNYLNTSVKQNKSQLTNNHNKNGIKREIDRILNQFSNKNSKFKNLSSFESYYNQTINYLINKKISYICIILEYDFKEFKKDSKYYNVNLSENDRLDKVKLNILEPLIKAYVTEKYNEFKSNNKLRKSKKRIVKVLSDREKIQLENDQYKLNKSVIIVPKGYHQ